MRSPLALAARVVAAVAVFTTALALSPSALAVTVPETLADQRPVQVGPVEPGFPIDHLGVIWDDDDHHGHAGEHAGEHAEEPGAHGAVRFRTDGRWGPWIDLVPDGADAPGQWASGLVPGGDADAYQVRGVPAHAGGPRAVALNTTDGPAVEVGERPADTAGALTSCLSRADWGADESLRFTKRGNKTTETWPPEFYDVQTLTVHHTAGKNDDPDPESTVRAIYQYHAVNRGWGDIGYQYLVDEAGRVYEGRWSGTQSRSCLYEGGDGSDFGHEEGDLDVDGVADEMVTGAHVGGWNSGNMGVSLLGDFTSVEPKSAAVTSLEEVLTELSRRHGLDPTGIVHYVNPVNGDTKTIDTISGHRDWEATECPGDLLHPKLPTIRSNVEAALPPSVTVTSPIDGSAVKGSWQVTADASKDVTSVSFVAGGIDLGTDTVASDGWAAPNLWDTTAFPEDSVVQVSATAVDTTSQTGTQAVEVTVDNLSDSSPEPAPLSVTSISATLKTGANDVTIGGSGFAEGATVTFLNGRGSTPTAVVTGVASDGSSLSATVTVEAKGPDGKWDIQVTLNGQSAVCAGCAYVDR